MPTERSKSVVVTGMGVVSPLGLTLDTTWDGLVAGSSGVGPITLFDASAFPVRFGAEAHGFDGAAVFGKRRARHLDRAVQLALTATAEALEGAKLDIGSMSERVAVVYGTGIGGIGALEEGIQVLFDRGPEWVNPYVLPMMIPNMAAGQIAMEWGIRGVSSCTVTACSASAQAIGEGFDLIRLGRADAVVCGGAEAAITQVGIAGFAAMKALSTRNDDPCAASRPFDAERDGFVMGEAAATLVLESKDLALARGAPILAELVGYGATSDAYHMTAPHPEGDGAVRAMREACRDADLDPSAIGYVNAHGTSTLPNDRIETMALKRTFGDRAPLVSSTKSMTGHTLGAAGALEAAVCVQVLRTGVVPPTINYRVPDPECDLDYVPNHARTASVDYVMSNSFGFGGHNAALIFHRV